ncbi:alpha/beta hydrolase [Nakamurella lactea]|uniref:alpha/beta hydrolase n=1 Tax=Nakamurella lactea TaxID=459515 RepID=UPI0004085FB1|nr:alpha/beta-hydrolase family protein [Nakamurella lactea]
MTTHTDPSAPGEADATESPGPGSAEPAPDDAASTAAPDERTPDDPAAEARGRSRFRYTLPGLWVALLFVCLSFTPSLLPRPGAFQGFVCGVNGAIGYGLGVLGAWVWRQFADRPARAPRRRSWQVFAVVAAVALVASYLLGLRWQLRIRELLQAQTDGVVSQLLLPVVGALVFVGLVAAGRGLRRCYRWIAKVLSRWMGRRAARALGWAAVAGLTLLLVTGVLLDGIVGLAQRSFAVQDGSTGALAVKPDTALRSGGPGSLVAWDTLGFQGRNFIGQGPTVAEISAFNDSAAVEPIRAYAGIASADDIESRAQLAVDDLQRAGGFDRGYLLVAGTTGTGWVDPGALTSLEYETGGDVASVAIQYSYLPSWASIMVDQERARQAGRELFDAVYERWSALPADHRPKLLVFGESLGSFSAEAAFSGEYDLRNRTDGAMFAGAPSFNPLHRAYTDGRDAGSPQIEPVYRDGRIVRFSSDPAEPIAPADAPWTGTRVLYLQHPSDPVTWLSPDLILHRPDWLAEQRGRDVLDEMTWIPFVTFWQVAADMLEPVEVPPGHGHVYTQEYVDGWAAIVQPPGWTAEKSAELRRIVERPRS